MQIKDPTKQIWFTRREKQVRGPFPAAMISRHILLGRIVMDDELSLDQCNWHQVTDVPELIPEERRLDLSVPHNRQRLEQAIIRADERNAGDRRQLEGEGEAQQYQRRAGDRRAPESDITLVHRNVSSSIAKSLKPESEKYRAGYVIILLLIALVLGLSLSLSKHSPAPVINVACSSIAAPSLDWSNCHKENKDLRDVDLASANLSHGHFEHANFSNATLHGANLEYINLSEVMGFQANLQSANLAHAILKAANLNSAILRQANLSFAILVDADLRGADLRGADLTHAVLNRARIDGARFDGAILDQTIWINNVVCRPESRGQCLAVASMPTSSLSSQPIASKIAQSLSEPIHNASDNSSRSGDSVPVSEPAAPMPNPAAPAANPPDNGSAKAAQASGSAALSR